MRTMERAPIRTLSEKLGFKGKLDIKLINEPSYYFELFDDIDDTVKFNSTDVEEFDCLHIFVRDYKSLKAGFKKSTFDLKKDSFIWVSWPKKSSKVLTKLDEKLIRTTAKDFGYTSSMTCSLDEVWSAIRLSK